MEKSIQPISSWKNGEELSANTLSVILINDNLESSATFYYQLKTNSVTTNPEGEEVVTGIQIAEGNTSLSGEDYTNWDGSNDAALTIVATKLNLIII